MLFTISKLHLLPYIGRKVPYNSTIKSGGKNKIT